MGAGVMFFLSRSLRFGEALRRMLRTVNVRGISMLAGLILPIAIALLWGLVLRTRLMSHEQQSTSSSLVLENDYDVGEVLSGEVVSHAFVFTNTTGAPLLISDDKDIRKDCGCAAVEPEARQLQPGASMKIVVEVNTREKSGRFAYGGTIAWSPPDGEKIEAIFRLHGELRPALAIDPTYLAFGPDEVNGRVTKEITITANVPMDWAKANVRGYDHDPKIQIVAWEASENRAVCKVKCFMPDGVEAANGFITVEVPLAEPRPDFLLGYVRIPVQGYQSVEFTVAPKQLLAKVDKADGHASARLLVRGKKVANSKRPISSITCEGYRVDWRMTAPSKDGVAVVNLELIPVAGSAQKGEPEVVMEVEGMKPIRLSLVKLMVSSK